MREFQLLLERKRLSTWGITTYELHKKSGRIIFPASSSLYQCLDTGYNVSSCPFAKALENLISRLNPQSNPLYPSELVQLRGALDPQVCPDNSEIIAYISSGDIWVVNMMSGHCKRLTNTHDDNKSLSDNPLSAGVPSYVMQEEFSRYQGFWWQPKSHGKLLYKIFLSIYQTKKRFFLNFFLFSLPARRSVSNPVRRSR